MFPNTRCVYAALLKNFRNLFVSERLSLHFFELCLRTKATNFRTVTIDVRSSPRGRVFEAIRKIPRASFVFVPFPRVSQYQIGSIVTSLNVITLKPSPTISFHTSFGHPDVYDEFDIYPVYPGLLKYFTGKIEEGQDKREAPDPHLLKERHDRQEKALQACPWRYRCHRLTGPPIYVYKEIQLVLARVVDVLLQRDVLDHDSFRWRWLNGSYLVQDVFRSITFEKRLHKLQSNQQLYEKNFRELSDSLKGGPPGG